jgi:alkanesulfonate monooxygenase SsuD/methylene tetrahydromethanopterin reductase-like flavin-dependent oxidoreductase (luciferase family)
MTASAEAEFARDVEQWGYSALWTPEAMGRDVLVNSGWLLANTRNLVIASGIANIFARDAMAMAAVRAAQQAIGRKTFARHGHFARTDCERDTRSHL